MYCPSSVGTANCDQVSSGRKNNGPNVVIMCKKSNGITIRSAPFIKNRIPITHSKSPKKIKNESKLMKCIVFSNNLCTRPLAGESPTTFKIPNQKNTANKPNRATGIEYLLKKCMRCKSMFRKFIKLL